MIRGAWALGPAYVRQPGAVLGEPRAVPSGSRRPLNPLRRQPPAHSPIPVGALLAAVGASLRIGADPRPRLERWLAREYGARGAALYDSGSAGLQVAITRAMRDAGSARVALPAYTCFSVASAAVGAGASIALYDLDPATLGPDFEQLARVLGDGVRVVVVAPLYGVPVNWDALDALLHAHGAIGVEDAAQGHGATWRGRPLGSFGRYAVLSFGRGKGWTGGAAGAVLDRSNGHAGDGSIRPAGVAAGARAIGAASAQWALGRPALYGLPSRIPALGLGETRYPEPAAPRTASRAAARILECSRTAAAREAGIRRANGASYAARLGSRRGIECVRVDPRGAPGYLRFPLRTSGGWAGLADPARAQALGAAPGYPSTLAELAPVRARMEPAAGWPGARELARRLVTLPTHSGVTDAEREQILAILDRP